MGMAMGGAIAGGVSGFFQSYMASEQAEQDAKFNKQIAKFNAAMARNAATEAMNNETYTAELRTRDAQIAGINRDISTQQAERVGLDTRVASTAMGKSIRAHAAGAGLSADEGSPLLARLTSARLGEYDATVAEFGYRMNAFKNDDDAKMLMNEAEVHTQRATYLRDYGIQASGALLDAQAQFYGNWEKYQSETRWTQAIVGMIGGVFGADHSKVIANQAADGSRIQGVQPYSYDRGTSESAYQDQRAGERLDYASGASNYGKAGGHYGEEWANVNESGSGAFRISEGNLSGAY